MSPAPNFPCGPPTAGHWISNQEGSGVSAALSNGAGSFISNPTSVLLMRKLRSRAGSGVIFSTARQSVWPLIDMAGGIDERRAHRIRGRCAAEFKLRAGHRPIARLIAPAFERRRPTVARERRRGPPARRRYRNRR